MQDERSQLQNRAEGDARPAGPPLRGRARPPGGRAGGGAQGAGRRRGARREDPHLQLSRRTASPTTGSASAAGSQDVLAGDLFVFTEALDRRRAAARARGRGGLTLGEVLARNDRLPRAQGSRHPAARRRADPRARVRPDADRALHQLRQAAERGRARGGAHARRAARPARAARLRARRLGLPAPHAADRRARARASARDRDRRRAGARR